MYVSSAPVSKNQFLRLSFHAFPLFLYYHFHEFPVPLFSDPTYLPRTFGGDHFFEEEEKKAVLDFMSHILARAVCRCVFWQPFVSTSAVSSL